MEYLDDSVNTTGDLRNRSESVSLGSLAQPLG
jgi:hypothetical protein